MEPRNLPLSRSRCLYSLHGSPIERIKSYRPSIVLFNFYPVRWRAAIFSLLALSSGYTSHLSCYCCCFLLLLSSPLSSRPHYIHLSATLEENFFISILCAMSGVCSLWLSKYYAVLALLS